VEEVKKDLFSMKMLEQVLFLKVRIYKILKLSSSSDERYIMNLLRVVSTDTLRSYSSRGRDTYTSSNPLPRLRARVTSDPQLKSKSGLLLAGPPVPVAREQGAFAFLYWVFHDLLSH
jgi:hypothetical protein